MYKEYDKKLVITVNDWLSAGLSISMLWRDSKNQDLSIVRRGKYGNTLIDIHSVKRLDRRQALEKMYGKIEKETSNIPYLQIEPDQSALLYFRDEYRYGEDGDLRLPQEAIQLYCNEAAILNTVKRVLEKQRIARASSTHKKKKCDLWAEVSCFCNSATTQKEWFNHLPKNVQSFERKFKQYLHEGYSALVSKKYGNTNTEKIHKEAGNWLVARYASMIDIVTIGQLFIEYNTKAIEQGWKILKSEQTLYKYLHKPSVEIQWYGARHGELLSKQRFIPQHRTLLPTMRDSIWYGDGTKLNYYYRDECGNIATCSVYEVMDAYSECLLGYHISKTEDFEQQYKAYRKALNFSGHKPYELRYDNQGGHKKLTSAHFMQKMSHLCIATQPYNGNSKTIEYAFKDFQSRYLHKDWFFTGQNITSKKLESRVNRERLDANKQYLPNLAEISKVYEMRRTEWNQASHSKTGIARIQMYSESENPKSHKIEMRERISLFGIMTEKASTFRASGLEIRIKGEKYVYDVLDEDGMTDYDFRLKHTNKKFIVEYDLEDMRIVNLYEQTPAGLKFAGMGQKYISIHRGKQEQNETDYKIIAQRDAKNKTMRMTIMNTIENTLEKHGLHPSQHNLQMPKIRGIKQIHRYENMNDRTEKTKKTKHGGKDILGKLLKEESNRCELEINIRNEY